MDEKPKKKLGRPIEWTEERAMDAVNGLLDWMAADDEHVFISEFMLFQKDMSREQVRLCKDRYPAFLDAYKKALSMQETKLVKLASKGKHNPVFTIFLLKNLHDYTDVKHTKNENTTTIVHKRDELEKMDGEGLKEQIRKLCQTN